MVATASRFTMVGSTVLLFITSVVVTSGMKSMMVIPSLAVIEVYVGGKVSTGGHLVSSRS